MNTNRDGLSGSDLEMPSGFEVEAATFHAPEVAEFTIVTPERSNSTSTMREKLDSLKSQSRMKLHDVQHLMNEKTAVMKSSLQRSVTTARSTMERSMNQANATVQTGLHDMQADMRVNPMKWAGIAAGSGFALGLLGRMVSWRSRHRHGHGMPQLVIIESAC